MVYILIPSSIVEICPVYIVAFRLLLLVYRF